MMVEIKLSNPDSLHNPVGPYCQVGRVKASEWIFLAGQTSTDRDGKTVGADDIEAQCKQVFSAATTCRHSSSTASASSPPGSRTAIRPIHCCSWTSCCTRNSGWKSKR